MEFYKLYLIFSFFLLCPNVDGFLALVPFWKATAVYSGITTEIDSYNNTFARKLVCIFPLSLPKPLMIRWEDNLTL